ncbi:hypothetical protein M408DRAFT_328166 [Serendipita vermifera MAFF 305830]|uniref:Transcription factor domain-containing protein n=1 Tax=Serendipita vermifera MAFF 305830 TaxID=933852 RepID=A0A0C3BET9_SERVB|nr:hypothetical protein M408DRAFT_328166 [Serendipita vermifera MAFF 305830]
MSQLPPSASADSSDSSHLFFSPNMHHQQRHPNHHHHIHHHHRPKPQPQPLSRIASQLLSLLKRTSLPAEYASIASQLLDLHLFKSHALASQSSHANVEHEAARRAQLIDAELTRLANRSAFDNLFAGTTGFAFDPSTFLSPSQSHPSTSPYTYSSPMTVWSPELVSDSMSTFSGSSAPTSPAAPLLAMSSSHHASTSLDLFYDPMAQHQQHQHQQLYDSYLPMHHTLAQPQHQPQQQQFGSALGFGNLGALGLSSDFLFSDYSSSPSISLLPPTPTPTMLPPPAKVAPSAAIASVVPPSPTQPQHDSDPLQIHHETCTLLLQAVLSTTGSSQFEYVNPSQELEECLQRLTTKFAPLSLSSSPSLSTEYLFGATVAGAMSVSADRRAFFRRIVAAIESRSASSECIAMLDEAWRD